MMYTKSEILEAMEAANENIKEAKAQIKRAEKMVAIQNEIFDNNCFGYNIPYIVDFEEFCSKMDKLIETSKANLTKYKKMLKLIDQLEEMSGVDEIEGE